MKPIAPAARAIARTIGSIVAAFAGVSLAAYLFRPELETVAKLFVARTGYVGMFVGSFVSDAVMFPIPPQFYMLTAVASGAPEVPSLFAVCLGSVVAASLVYPLSGRLAQLGFVQRRIDVTRAKVAPILERHGYWAVFAAAVSPIPFSWLCYFMGLYRMPARHYALFVILRVPRLLAFYFVIRAGWLSGI